MKYNMRCFWLFLLITIASCHRALEVQSSGNKNVNSYTVEAYIIEGMRHFIVDNYSDAKISFDKAYSLQPENATVNYMLAQIYLGKGNMSNALQYGNRAIKFDKNNQFYYLLVAHIYKQQQNPAEAIKVLKKMLADVPGTSEYYFEVASLYIQQKNYDEAYKAYTKAENALGKSPEISRQKQQLLLQLNKLDLAISEGETLMEEFPDEVEFKVGHTELLFHNGKVNDALMFSEKTLQDHPDEPYLRHLVVEMYFAEKNYGKAYKHLDYIFSNPEMPVDLKLNMIENVKKFPASETKNTKLISYSNALLEHHSSDPKSYAAAGDVFILLQDKEKALENYVKAKELNNSHFALWNQILALDAELNKKEDLLKHSSEALEIFPNHALFWLYNGSAYLMTSDYESAIESLEEGLKLSSGNIEMSTQFKLHLADSYNGIKNYKKSDALYYEVLKVDINNPHALNNFSYYLSLRNENLEKAKEMSFRLINRFPDNPHYLDTHAWVLYKLNQYAEAKEYLEKAAAIIDNGTVIEHYGDVLYQLGDVENAVKNWEKAKKLGDTTDLIDKKIKDRKLYE